MVATQKLVNDLPFHDIYFFDREMTVGGSARPVRLTGLGLYVGLITILVQVHLGLIIILAHPATKARLNSWTQF